MKFVCDKCKTKYSIADDKVRRKVLKIRCKNCSNIIIVREPGRPEDGDPVQAQPQHRSSGSGVRPLAGAFDGAFRARRRSSSALKPVPAARAALRDLPALDDELEPEETRLSTTPDFDEQALLSEDEWYLAVDANQYGPMAFNELCSRVKRGEAGGEAYVWRDGFDDWLDVATVPELRSFLPRHPPPPPRGKSGLFSAVAAMGTPHMGVPTFPAPPQGPIATYATPAAPVVAPIQQPQAGGSQVAPMPPPGLQGPPGSGLFPVQPPVRIAEPAGQVLPQEPDLSPVPPVATPGFHDAAPVAPVQMPAGRTPLWMVIAGVGGGLAAVCGLILVGYLLFFERADKDAKVVANQSARQPGVAEPEPEELIPDAGGGPIAFAPMEIEQSHKGERKVGGGRPRQPKPRRPATDERKQMSAEQRRLMALYGDKENPTGSAPKAGPTRRTHQGPKRRVSSRELSGLQRQHRATLKACYERALKRDDTLTEIKAVVEVSIGDTGVVRRVSVSAGNNPDLISCIRRCVKRWVFPAIGSQAFSFPIIFRGT